MFQIIRLDKCKLLEYRFCCFLFIFHENDRLVINNIIHNGSGNLVTIVFWMWTYISLLLHMNKIFLFKFINLFTVFKNMKKRIIQKFCYVMHTYRSLTLILQYKNNRKKDCRHFICFNVISNTGKFPFYFF